MMKIILLTFLLEIFLCSASFDLEDAIEKRINSEVDKKLDSADGEIAKQIQTQVTDKINNAKGKVEGIVKEAVRVKDDLISTKDAALSGVNKAKSILSNPGNAILGSALGAFNNTIFMGERVCCATSRIYSVMNDTYREINKDLATTEVLVKMYSDETNHTIDIATNRIDENEGISHYEYELLDEEVNATHVFFEATQLPEKYSLNQIVKIAVVRETWHDKIINSALNKKLSLIQIKNLLLTFSNSLSLDRIETKSAIQAIQAKDNR